MNDILKKTWCKCVARDLYDKCDTCYNCEGKSCYIPFPDEEVENE